MSRFAVFAMNCRQRDGAQGIVAVLNTKEEAEIVKHILLDFRYFAFFIEEYSPIEHEVHPDANDILDAAHYYTWEHPKWWVTDEYRKVINRACAIMQPFGSSGREHLEPAF